jgi:hypothetical protein
VGGFFRTCECGRDLERCHDCGEWLCWSCDGADHEREHIEHEAEREERHREVDREFGPITGWRDEWYE